jgi:pSer/pThr/pTyr-binding forkhead associated (FHA) protein
MVGSPGEGPAPSSGAELQEIIRAEREGHPFFVHRDGDGNQEIVRFPADRGELAVGRSPTADLSIGWDPAVSGLHAELEQRAGEVAVIDDGLSRNGTFVNGERVHGRRRLQDGDMLRFGSTVVLVRNPSAVRGRPTMLALDHVVAADLSEQQRKVLIALCRPFRGDATFESPPTNQQLAAELYLSVAAVKLHLRSLFDKFEIPDLPQNKKRLALVRAALQSGVITDRELAVD